ncbi:MAG: type IV pilus assembly protein PilM [Patescibacteria group bacterium]
MVPFTKHSIGLDISDTSVEALELSGVGRSRRVVAFSRNELAPGIVQGGRVVDSARLTSALATVVAAAKPGKFSTHDVVLALPESQTFTHIFQLPAVLTAASVGESVQYAAEETIPLPFDQTYHDYEVLSRGETVQQVLYVASSKVVVDGYCAAAAAAGLRIGAVEPASLSLARALVPPTAPALVVDIGTRVTTASLYDQYSLHYSRSIEFGGDVLAEQVAAAAKIDHAAATVYLRSVGLPGAPEVGSTPVDISHLLQPLVDLIERARQYHRTRAGTDIPAVVLCGGASLLPGLPALLTRQLGTEVRLGNPLADIRAAADTFGTQPAILFATVIGAASRGTDGSFANRGVNYLAHASDHRRFTATRDVSVPASVPAREQRLSTRLSRRSTVLVSVFICLVVVFAVVLLLQLGRSEPLIQLPHSDYPAGPVPYGQ